MSTYVISDIHGCYDTFLSLLKIINFTDSDCLILAGDYIDRGNQNYEMLQWITHCPPNVHLLRGNHEEEFAAYVDLMLLVDHKEELDTDFSSNLDTTALYSSVDYFLHCKAQTTFFFFFFIINNLLAQYPVTLHDLCRWSARIRQMPYYEKLFIGNRICVVVHAGYTEQLETKNTRFHSLKQFYLYARDEVCQLGGIPHGMIIAGHTPTIIKGAFAYNRGNVFRYYDDAMDCIFYDIDCGCVFQNQISDAKLACIRLEDEKIFYAY